MNDAPGQLPLKDLIRPGRRVTIQAVTSVCRIVDSRGIADGPRHRFSMLAVPMRHTRRTQPHRAIVADSWLHNHRICVWAQGTWTVTFAAMMCAERSTRHSLGLFTWSEFTQLINQQCVIVTRGLARVLLRLGLPSRLMRFHSGLPNHGDAVSCCFLDTN